jgi:ubiquinone biosynthesis protein
MRLIFRHDGLDNFISELDRSSNRIAFSVITAAIILSSSVIMLARVGPQWHDVAILGLVGFLIAAVAGLWLLVSIFRSGRF